MSFSLPITAIYQRYHIMPSLQLHMRRVAALAQAVCKAFDQPLEEREIVSACLLHDMGNILKSDLISFPDFLEPEGKAYWQLVKDDFKRRYGTDVHEATVNIVKELGLSARTLELVDAVGFQQLPEVAASEDWAKKICNYADARVMPRQIATLAERWADLEVRYGLVHNSLEDQQRRQAYGKLLAEMETQSFSHTSLQPDQLSDETLQAEIEALRTFEVI